MRSKISFHSDLSLPEMQVWLSEHHWVADQQSELAKQIKEDIMDAVALEHKELAERSFQFVVYDLNTDARGILCHDSDSTIIRLKNKDVLSLQVSTLRLIELFKMLSQAKNRRLTFDGIQILERKIRRPLLEGHILDSDEARIAYARKEKIVEFRIAHFAALIAITLCGLSFTRTLFARDYFMHVPYGMQIEWAYDIVGKLIGSSVMTSIISFLNYRAYVKSLEDTIIRWQVPKVQDVFK